MPIDPRLQELLDAHEIEYETIHHRRDFRARLNADDTHTPPGEFAKTVVIHVDGSHAISESEMKDLMPGYEIGAAPPFSSLCGLRIYASLLLPASGRSPSTQERIAMQCA